jgi:hypothetical protein
LNQLASEIDDFDREEESPQYSPDLSPNKDEQEYEEKLYQEFLLRCNDAYVRAARRKVLGQAPP